MANSECKVKVVGLRDADGLEAQAISIKENDHSRLEHYPQLWAAAAQYLDEIPRQQQRLEQLLEIRRQMAEVEAQQAALRDRQAELEKFLFAAPAADWEEAVEKARYLIGLFAETPVGRDSRYRKITADVLEDFGRLSGRLVEPLARTTISVPRPREE